MALPPPAVKEIPKLDFAVARKENKCREFSIIIKKLPESESATDLIGKKNEPTKNSEPAIFEPDLQKRKSIRIAIAQSILAIPDRPSPPSPVPEEFKPLIENPESNSKSAKKHKKKSKSKKPDKPLKLMQTPLGTS